MTNEQSKLDQQDATTRIAAIAHGIAYDDYATEANGYASWESNHSCGGYIGCCGGGKEIDHPALQNAIESAIKAALARVQEERDTLRAALVGLIGADGREELEQMEAVMRLMPAPAADKAASVDAIHALIASLP